MNNTEALRIICDAYPNEKYELFIFDGKIMAEDIETDEVISLGTDVQAIANAIRPSDSSSSVIELTRVYLTGHRERVLLRPEKILAVREAVGSKTEAHTVVEVDGWNFTCFVLESVDEVKRKLENAK